MTAPALFEVVEVLIRGRYVPATVAETHPGSFTAELPGGGRCSYWDGDDAIGLWRRPEGAR